MYRDKKVIVVMPAYNAGDTLERTHEDVMAQDCVDHVILVDDASQDPTVEVAYHLQQVSVFRHDRNRGYGANQKTCYQQALDAGADIVVMIHPDYQYTPLLIPAMVSMIGNGLYQCVIASRILGGYALKGGMPRWRYVSNRFLTCFENLLLQAKLSEYHTGYRAFSRTLLERIPLEQNSDDFLFDNQMLAQILWMGYPVGEVSCPTYYATDSSSIDLGASVRYGLGCLSTSIQFFLARKRVLRSPHFPSALRGIGKESTA